MQCRVQRIEQTGDCGMYMSTIEVDNHGDAITVIGVDLTECVKRTYVVIKALQLGDSK